MAGAQADSSSLSSASTAAAATDLPVMLGAVLSALPAGRLPQALDYTPGQLQLDGLVLAPKDVQALTSQSQAYSIKVQGPTLSVRALP
jgi:general secretion pathway protein L